MQTRLLMIVIKKKKQYENTHLDLGKTSCDRHRIEIRKKKNYFIYILCISSKRKDIGRSKTKKTIKINGIKRQSQSYGVQEKD
jgi:hypothetical protein